MAPQIQSQVEASHGPTSHGDRHLVGLLAYPWVRFPWGSSHENKGWVPSNTIVLWCAFGQGLLGLKNCLIQLMGFPY